MKFKSREKEPPKKEIPRKLISSFFTVLNFNEIACKWCEENDYLAFVFLTFRNSTRNPRKCIPGVTSEIQIRENVFPRNSKNPKSMKLTLRKFHATL